jgi:flavin-dependent dehydrogenase
MIAPEFAAGKEPRPRTVGHRFPAESDYDVVIVGARVAGASTAMLLARRGYRVLVIDRAPMPSDVVSTHAILRTGILQLSRWGVLGDVVAAGTPAVRDVTLGFGEERIEFDVRAEHGVDTFYAPRRHILDNILLESAMKAGADFAERTRMVELVRSSNGNVTGIVAKQGDREQVYTARIVIGADGVFSRMAKLVEATDYLSHAPTNAINYAYYRDLEATGFWFQFTPGVNAGIIPTNENLCCVFVARASERMADFSVDSEAEFNRLLSKAGADLWGVVAAGSRVSQFRGTSLPGFLRQPWGPGWALVGDAGYTKDPISAHGISDGLRDAELCARAVDRALSYPGETSAAMSEYHRTRDHLSIGMFRDSEALARYEWDAEEASARMRAMSEAVRAECAILESLGAWLPAMSPA